MIWKRNIFQWVYLGLLLLIFSVQLLFPNTASSQGIGTYNPTDYNLLGATSCISGELTDIQSNDATSMRFRGNYGTDISDFVDNISDVDSFMDKGAHSNFENQKDKDSIYDTLTEENTGGTGTDVEDYVDATSDVDSSPDIGTHSNFENQKAKDTTYDTLTEASTSVGGDWGLDRSDGTSTAIAEYRYMGGTSPNIATMTIIKLHYYASVAGQIAIGVWEGGILTNATGASKILQALNVTVAVGWNEIDVTDTSWSANTISWIGWTNGGTGSQSAYVTTGDFGDFADVSGRWSQTVPAAADVTQDMNDTITAGSFSAYWYCMYIEYSAPDSYQLDLEVQFTSVDYDEINEYLCIYVGSTDAENITVDYWTGSGWSNLLTDLAPNTWNNVTVSLTSATFTIRVVDGTPNGDTNQDSWQIDACLVHVWGDPQNWELDLEVQFTDFIDFLATEKLCIYAGTLGAEDLNVDFWNGTGWENLATDLTANSWNNYTVSLTSPTFTIRFKDGTNVGDTTTQDQWQIDASLLRVEGAGSKEDAVDNDTSDVDSSSDIGTLSNFDNMKAADSTYANLTESAPITYINYAEASATTGTSAQVNKPAGTAEDDFMIALLVSTIGSDANGSTMSSAPAGWTNEYDYIQTAISGQHVYIYWKVAGASEPSSYTWSWTDSCGWVAQITTFSGVDTGSPIHVEGTVNQESSNSPMSPSVTTTEDNCMIWLYDMSDGSAVPAGGGAPGGTTWIDQTEVATPGNGLGISTAYFVQASTGATGNQDWTLSAIDENSGQQYALKPAGTDYQLDQEVQWTDLTYELSNEELCLYGGTMGSEDIEVEAWNGTGWETIFNDLSSGWNNISVSDYLYSSTFTIRFKGGNETGDTSQDSWNIDVTLLHIWSNDMAVEVEFLGSSNIDNWSQLTWTVDSAWTTGSVNVTLQLYNYTLNDYSPSGNGYVNYTSNSILDENETVDQIVTANPAHFRNATGHWKVKIKGVKAVDSQLELQVDLIKYEVALPQSFDWTTAIVCTGVVLGVLLPFAVRFKRKKKRRKPTASTHTFPERFGVTPQQMVGKKTLLEVDPTLDYHNALFGFVSKAITDGQSLFIFTGKNSPLHTAFCVKNIGFFLLTSKVSSSKRISKKEVLIPVSDLSVLLDAFAKILRERTRKPRTILFDNISDTILMCGFDKTYRFLRFLLEAISSPKITALFIFNPSAHDPAISSSIRGLFQFRLTDLKLKIVEPIRRD